MSVTGTLRRFGKTALAPLARFTTRDRARVVMYHRFGSPESGRGLDVEMLERHLRHLSERFRVVPLSRIVSALRAGRSFEPYTVAITVDDAYADFGELAYPVFRRLGLPVTLYVVSEFSEGDIWLWWDAIRYLLDEAEEGSYRIPIDGGAIALSLTDAQSRRAAWSTLADAGLPLSPERRDAYLERLQRVLGRPLPARPTREYSAMSWQQLRALSPQLVEIGAHTRTHPVLKHCDDRRIRDEVADSKARIEAQLQRRVSAFCYPNGQWGDVDDRCRRAVRDAGFDSAVMACGDLVDGRADPYALERIALSDTYPDFVSELAGVPRLRRRLAGAADRAR